VKIKPTSANILFLDIIIEFFFVKGFFNQPDRPVTNGINDKRNIIKRFTVFDIIFNIDKNINKIEAENIVSNNSL